MRSILQCKRVSLVDRAPDHALHVSGFLIWDPDTNTLTSDFKWVIGSPEIIKLVEEKMWGLAKEKEQEHLNALHENSDLAAECGQVFERHFATILSTGQYGWVG